LSTWYIKNSRARFKSENINERLSAMNTLSYVLTNLAKLLGPLTPFISEMIYQKLKDNGIVSLESVHLEYWPEFNEDLIDIRALKYMELTREVVKRSLELRDNAKIPVRQVLNELTIKGVNLKNEYLEIIAEAINVKKVTVEKHDDTEFMVELDTKITPTLRLEGIARNLIRHLNNYRKQLNLSTNNRINLYLKIADKDISKSLEKHEEYIKKMIQADVIIQNLEGKTEIKKLKIEDKVVEAFIEVKN
ncbi:MAG: class I tRNA ligase family protein, partial [Promethearchaeota archaeon]